MKEDSELLRLYVEFEDEAAFSELVERYISLVFSAAVRQLSGDFQSAEDVTQIVFADLARKAGSLSSRGGIAGWLYTSTRFAAAKLRRGDERRRAREQRFVEMNGCSAPQSRSDGFEELAPVLDEAMHELKASDRDLLLLRYFQGQALKIVGQAVGVSEAAAQMRLTRALQKLRRALERRNVTLSAGALERALGGGLSISAPAGLIAMAAGSALANAAAGPGTIVAASNLFIMTKIKTAVACAALAGLAAVNVVQYRSGTALRDQNMSLHQQILQLGQLEDENERLRGQHVSLEAPNVELIRLRGEVARLRNETAVLSEENARLQKQTEMASQANRSLRQPEQQNQNEFEKRLQERAMKAGHIVRGLIQFANENNGQLPGTLEAIRDLLPTGEEFGTVSSDLELVFIPGELAKLPDPRTTIILRDKEPTLMPDGRFAKIYGFAAGHTQIRYSLSNDFAAWEAEWSTKKKEIGVRSILRSAGTNGAQE